LSSSQQPLDVQQTATTVELDSAFRDAINANARWAAKELAEDLSPERIFATIHELALRGWEHNDAIGAWPSTEEDHQYPLRRLPDKLFGHMVGESFAASLAILAGHEDVYLNVHSAADLSFGLECKTARQQRDQVYALNNLAGEQPVLFMGITRAVQAGTAEPLLFATIPQEKVSEMVSLSGRENGQLNLRLRGHSSSGAAGIAASCYTRDAEDVVEFLRAL
jgi:hypothetical protein